MMSLLSNCKALTQEKNDCLECKCSLYIEPIGYVNLTMGENKDSVLSRFDSYKVYELQYDDIYKDKEEEYFTTLKTIILPNGETTTVEAILAFKFNRLMFFTFQIDIGKDGKYYHKLLQILKDNDVHKVNDFLKEIDNQNSFYVEKNNCARMFGMNRKFDSNGRTFQIDVKYTYTGSFNE